MRPQMSGSVEVHVGSSVSISVSASSYVCLLDTNVGFSGTVSGSAIDLQGSVHRHIKWEVLGEEVTLGFSGSIVYRSGHGSGNGLTLALSVNLPDNVGAHSIGASIPFPATETNKMVTALHLSGNASHHVEAQSACTFPPIKTPEFGFEKGGIKFSGYFEWDVVKGLRFRGTPELEDGTYCLAGTSCLACKNDATWWFGNGVPGFRCGTEPCNDGGWGEWGACVLGAQERFS